MAKSTIAIILKNRGTIKKADFYRGVTVIIKQRADDWRNREIVAKLGNMLAGIIVSEGMICEKARRLHDGLVKNILLRVVILTFEN